jgi:hypothetical protein
VYELFFPLTSRQIYANLGLTLWGLGLVLVGAAVIAVVVIRINTWYREHFGVVERTSRGRRLGTLVATAGVIAWLVPFEAEILAMNSGHALGVNLLDFTMGAWILAYWLYLGRSFRHYVWLAAAGFGLGALSIAGIPPSGFVSDLREATLYFAFATIVGGLIDHRILARTLPGQQSQVDIGS